MLTVPGLQAGKPTGRARRDTVRGAPQGVLAAGDILGENKTNSDAWGILEASVKGGGRGEGPSR